MNTLRAARRRAAPVLVLMVAGAGAACTAGPERYPVPPLPAATLEALRTEALHAAPPVETGDFRPRDFVAAVALDRTLHLDVRYATADHFRRGPVYTQARVFLQRPAAEAVVRVHRALERDGEWWHFDCRGWQQYRIGNVAFEALAG